MLSQSIAECSFERMSLTMQSTTFLTKKHNVSFFEWPLNKGLTALKQPHSLIAIVRTPDKCG